MARVACTRDRRDSVEGFGPQIAETLAGALALPDWVQPVAIILLMIGLVITVATAWVQSLPSTTAAGSDRIRSTAHRRTSLQTVPCRTRPARPNVAADESALRRYRPPIRSATGGVQLG